MGLRNGLGRALAPRRLALGLLAEVLGVGHAREPRGAGGHRGLAPCVPLRGAHAVVRPRSRSWSPKGDTLMAKIHGNGQWGNNRPGRRQVYRFTSVVSPLGADAAETPNYSAAS